MARKLNTEGKAVSIESVTLDTEKAYDGIIVGGGGNVNIVMLDGTTGVITLPAGMWPIAFKQINTASTTATGLFGTIEGTAS